MNSFNFVILALIVLQVYANAQQNNLSDVDLLFMGVPISGLIDESNKIIRAKETLDTLYSFPSPGAFPTGLAWDGQYFWNCDVDSLMIYKLTPTGNVVSSFPSPASDPAGLEWDGNYLWLVSEQEGLLHKIDTTTGLTIEQFQLPSFGDPDPNGAGLAWDGQFLWHSEYWDSAMIYKLNPQNGQVISSFAPPNNLILGITWVEGYLYGINIDWTLSGGTIYKFDTLTGNVLDSVFWEVPYPIGLTWDGNNFWNVSSRISSGGNARIYKVTNSITSIENNLEIKLHNFILAQNYPNPFNPSTKISWQSPVGGYQTLKIFDVLGNEVATLVDEYKPAGTYEVEWNASGLPSGVYSYQLKTNEFVATKKMMLMK